MGNFIQKVILLNTRLEGMDGILLVIDEIPVELDAGLPLLKRILTVRYVLHWFAAT